MDSPGSDRADDVTDSHHGTTDNPHGAADDPHGDGPGADELQGPAKVLGRWPLHPVLLAAWSVLVVWAGNVTEVPPGDGLRVLGLVVAATSALWLVVWVGFRLVGMPDPGGRSALTVTAAAGGFLVLGRLLPEASATTAFGVLGAVAVVGIVLGVWGPRLLVTGLGAVVNVFALVAVLVAAVPLGQGLAGAVGTPTAVPSGEPGEAGVVAPGRDIFYIVPDRYPRADTASELYGIDNAEFETWLVEHGFDIQDQARANYPKTAHSLVATWNLDYVQELVATPPDDPADWTPLYELMADHRLGRLLTDAGMDYVHIGSWWAPTASAGSATTVFDATTTSEFEAVWRSTTALRFKDTASGGDAVGERRAKYDLAVAQLDELERLAQVPASRPRLVVAHITVPHEPYVFNPDGSYVGLDTERARSREDNIANQMAWLNSRLQDLVDTLVAGDDATDPIVVIQSDEGPHPLKLRQESADWDEIDDAGRAEKLRTFSAWYLPGVDEAPPEDITGVNTWRWILDQYAGTEFGLLDDRVYVYPTHADRYTFEDVTDDFN